MSERKRQSLWQILQTSTEVQVCSARQRGALVAQRIWITRLRVQLPVGARLCRPIVR